MTKNNNPVTFGLSDGFIELVNETLIIHDRAKKDRLLLLFTSIIFLLSAFSHIYKWTQDNDKLQLAFGLILLILNLLIIWKWKREFIYVDNKIYINDITYFKLVNIKFDDTKVGLIKIKGKAYRRIKMNQTDIQEFSDYLKTRNIEVIT